MRIGGLQKLTLIDYPGKIAAIVFTQGCNFRCPFCHNPELVIPGRFGHEILEAEVLDFLRSHRKYLQGVVVSGGEPTQQGDLIEFLKKLREMEYLIKLDTNGSRPRVLQKIIDQKLVDYIAMDVKTSFDKYRQASGVNFQVDRIKKSIALIIQSGLSHEFRTTAVKSLCSWDDFLEIRNAIQGANSYKIQMFRESENILDSRLLKEEQYSEKEVELLSRILKRD